jgi:pimeloyl-ACP methyl ester carboxylesterase
MSTGPTTSAQDLGDGFVSETVDVNGTRTHYVRGGRGPTLVLLHGFPQDWYEWRRVIPRLAQRFTVLAVDLRGVGESGPGTDGGYAAVDLAGDVRGLLDALGLGPAHVVGHDIGGGVAYAFAREYPERTSTVTIMEFPIPGISPDPAVVDPLWHVPFHMTPDLPEALVTGRQTVYFRYFFDQFTSDTTAISDADVAHYAAAYRSPDRLRAGFEFFRAIPANEAYNLEHTDPIDVPLLLVGGEHLFGPIVPAIAENLRARHGWSDVTARTVAGAKHYLVEERPDEVAELIEGHAGARSGVTGP